MSFQDDRLAAFGALQASDPDRDYLVISHTIDRSLHQKLSRIIPAKKKNDAVTVFLTTRGGDPHGGYRVARCLRHHYSSVRLVVPSQCKSAGTLIAISANELAIGDLGELGPLDIQVLKGSELAENSSGLDINQALGAITVHTQETFHNLMMGTRRLGLSTRLCAEFAASVAASIAAPLISQIDPIRMGEMQRATRVAYEYGTRLNRYANNLRPMALNRLIGEYPAHRFVIDRKEAGELFVNVGKMNDAEILFCDTFWYALENEGTFDPEMIEFPDQAPPGDQNENDPETTDPAPADGPRMEGDGAHAEPNGDGRDPAAAG